MKFAYFETRPCIESKGNVTSFRDVEEFNAELSRRTQAARKHGTRSPKSYWTIYGIQDGAGEAVAIGDFVSQSAALEVMNAILAPMAAARDLISGADVQHTSGAWISGPEQATAALDDVILQSSSWERI